MAISSVRHTPLRPLITVINPENQTASPPKTALSYYNTGHPARGFNNGYVGKVVSAAERIVPAIGWSGPAGLSDSSPEAPPETSPSWDVFGDVRRGSNSFVTTVSTTAPGGPQ